MSGITIVKADSERAQSTETAFGCEARPKAAQRWQREDILCANTATISVRFYDRNLPVCRIHAATFARWATAAERNAVAFRGWAAQAA